MTVTLTPFSATRFSGVGPPPTNQPTVKNRVTLIQWRTDNHPPPPPPFSKRNEHIVDFYMIIMEYEIASEQS